MELGDEVSHVHAVQRHLAGTSKIHVAYIPLIIYYYISVNCHNASPIKEGGTNQGFSICCQDEVPKPHQILKDVRIIAVPLHSYYLGGGWTNPSEKYARQFGSFPQVGVKIRNIWNHHLVMIDSILDGNFTQTKSCLWIFSMNWLSNQGVSATSHRHEAMQRFEGSKLDPYQSTSWQLGNTCNLL